MTRPRLYIVGTPLDEKSDLPQTVREIFKRAEVIIGETRKLSVRYLKHNPNSPDSPKGELFFLDPPRAEDGREMKLSLARIAKTGGTAVLFSDTGMPILFDPGREVLELAKSLHFEILTAPGPTSWSVAAAVSGFAPPFLIADFLPREKKARMDKLNELKKIKAHTVLMETPYRFQALLGELKETYGADGSAFLAWEIARPDECYLWGTVSELIRQSETRKLTKGEFILILKSAPGASRPPVFTR